MDLNNLLPKAIRFVETKPNAKLLRKAETQVICSALNSTSLINDLVTKLTPSDFSNQELMAIYQAIYALHQKSEVINLTSVIMYIDKDPELKQTLVSPENFINNKLMPLYDGDELFNYYVEYIQVASIKRQLDNLCTSILNTTMDVATYDEVTFAWLNKFSEIIHAKKSTDVSYIKDILDDIDISIRNHMNSKNTGLTGIDTGFQSLNELTDGFQRGDLIILAARPGAGKTALSLNFALNGAYSLLNDNHNSNNNRKPLIVFFSMEMSKTELVQRMISREALVNLKKIRDFKLTNDELTSYATCKEKLAQLPILICDTSGLTIMDIQSTLKRLSSQYDIQLVIVDYLQLIKLTNQPNSGVNRQQEVSTISRILKQTAREINTPVIALSQLSRKIEERKGTKDENPRPVLSDLRESGAIEQDADIVTFLYYQYSPELYNQNDSDEQEPKPTSNMQADLTPITLAVEKHRNGPTGDCNLFFTKQYGLFREFKNIGENK